VDGPPTFEDLDEVPLAGPSPDHAAAYVPPRDIPKPADHKTIDISPIRISPDADPRRALTQKAMRVIKREDAHRQLLLMGVDATAATLDARAPQASESDGDSAGKSRAGLFIGGTIAVLVLAAGGFVAFKMVDPESASTVAPATTEPPSPATAPPSPAPTPAPTPTIAIAPATAVEPVAQPSSEPSPSAAPTPSITGRKKQPTEATPKPINE
jgi:hypothetical protein